VIDATVLDINDSNGMYGIEALSRGAKCAKFVNPNKKEANLTCENLDSLGLNSQQMVVCDNAEEYLKNPSSDCAGETYDVCFFNIGQKEDFDLVDKILERQNKDGITVVYYPDLDDFNLPEINNKFSVVETRDCEDKKVALIISAE
jgi:16S rRNA G966 N2-methylase RsmD